MIDLGTTVGALFTLMIVSIIFTDNVFYRLAVRIWFGSAVGFLTTRALNNLWYKNLVPLSAGKYALAIPLVLGCLLFFRFSKRVRAFARYPNAIVIGANMGAMVAGLVVTNIYRQLTGPVTSWEVALTVIWTVFILIYFTMTIRHEGPVGMASKIGRWMLFTTLGILFGNLAIARFSWLISRIQYFFITWLEIA